MVIGESFSCSKTVIIWTMEGADEDLSNQSNAYVHAKFMCCNICRQVEFIYLCLFFDMHGGEKAPVALGLPLSHLRQNELNRCQKEDCDSQGNSFF